MNKSTLCTILVICLAGCTGSRHANSGEPFPQPTIIPHDTWEAHAPLGYDANAVRRNLAPGDTLDFEELTLLVTSAVPATSDAASDSLYLDLAHGDRHSSLTIAEGAATIWDGYRIAVLAVHLDEGELGKGLAELELAVAASVPENIRSSSEAGGPANRLRVRHTPTHVTLHHSGSAEPLTADEDPVMKLRNLQTWGESDRGWWDVPYHFLIDLDGHIYEGRSYRYMGETNTRYNPSGHLLISVLGNYSLQQPTENQVAAIADLMAWSTSQFDIPLHHIQGHSDLAATECPGDHLRKLLQDGTFREMVTNRLTARSHRVR